MRVASIHIYPVKGMRAVDLDRVKVETRGLAHDRRWLVVDRDGNFLTQRSHPQLATIVARPTPSGLSLSAGAEEIAVETPAGRGRRKIVIWETEVDAAIADGQSAAWMTALMGEPASLVYMDDAAARLKVGDWTAPAPVSFADGYPVLVVATASLAALNRDIEAHGGEAVPMRRFRPNIVIEHDQPWAEDKWRRLAIGGAVLELVKPCDRCIVTTTDQTSGARMGKEPLAALARLRRSTDPRINGVLFGVNAVPRVLGDVRVGDAVDIVDDPSRPAAYSHRQW